MQPALPSRFLELIDALTPNKHGISDYEPIAKEFRASPESMAVGLKLFRETDDDQVRHALAIAAMDAKLIEAIDVIHDLLGDIDKATKCSTLIYVLGELSTQIPMELVIPVFEHGSLGAVCEIEELAVLNVLNCSPELEPFLIEYLAFHLESTNEEIASVAVAMIDCLRSDYL